MEGLVRISGQIRQQEVLGFEGTVVPAPDSGKFEDAVIRICDTLFIIHHILGVPEFFLDLGILQYFPACHTVSRKP